MFKNIVGISLMIIGIVLGCYLGIWVMFIGGILEIAHAIDIHQVTTVLIATNIIKMFFSGFIGVFIGFVGVGIGMAITEDN